MGKVRSVRFNEQTERMFNVIKSYYSKRGGITDSEIFSNGIRQQYAVIVEDMDKHFKELMFSIMNDNQELISFFNKICDLLEILSTTQGSTLADEFYSFLLVIVEQASIFEVDSDGKERYGRNAQYEKVWEKVVTSYGKDISNDELLCYLDEVNDLYADLFPDNLFKEK